MEESGKSHPDETQGDSQRNKVGDYLAARIGAGDGVLYQVTDAYKYDSTLDDACKSFATHCICPPRAKMLLNVPI
jgi:hypothetical protein